MPLCLYALYAFMPFAALRLSLTVCSFLFLLTLLSSLAQTERYGISQRAKSGASQTHIRSIAVPEANALRRGGRDKPSVNKVRKGKPQEAISQCKPYGVACVTEHDAENWRHG